MRYIIRVILIFTVLLNLCSCTKRVSLTAADELVMNKWSFKGENGYSATLEFKEALAYFTVYENDTCKIKIDGNYIISSEQFSITDTEFPATFTFKYDLNGNTVGLNYDGAEILMKRVEN